jgi:uridylate kinase
MAAQAAKLKSKRLLLKLSGEALMGKQPYGIDMAVADRLSHDIAEATAAGAEIAIVIGGGNIFRGLTGAAKGMDRATADYMGMLATVMNALAFQNALDHRGVPARVLSAIPMQTICESYVRPKALSYMAKSQVVLFAAGTGNPFFTTDTGAALRAAEMNCDAMLKGTQVDGVYTADPKVDADATRFDTLDYMEVLSKELKVMDATAISLLKENKIPIVVFRIREKGALAKVLTGQGVSTTIGRKK